VNLFDVIAELPDQEWQETPDTWIFREGIGNPLAQLTMARVASLGNVQ
jgi:hypothetical protein